MALLTISGMVLLTDQVSLKVKDSIKRFIGMRVRSGLQHSFRFGWVRLRIGLGKGFLGKARFRTEQGLRFVWPRFRFGFSVRQMLV